MIDVGSVELYTAGMYDSRMLWFCDQETNRK